MGNLDAYLFYEAGQAVAAVHLGLPVRRVCGNAAHGASEIVIARDDAKSRMVLWLTGMAAEKKGVGRSDPLRRMRNRMRVRSLLEEVAEKLKGSKARRRMRARQMLNQAQDRANSICTRLYNAIEAVVAEMRREIILSGQQIKDIVAKTKRRRRAVAAVAAKKIRALR